MSPEEIAAALGLKPHPEGGLFREIFRDAFISNGRAASTAIYYLLRKGEVSHWHRVDACEVWHWYAGAPLELLTADTAGVVRRVLGPDLRSGERPQIVIPAMTWQSARSLGDYSLAGCTVAPGFEFSGFEMAPPGWSP